MAIASINPATGESSFTGMMSESDEVRIGRESHPQVLAQFGGAYEDPELQRYIDSLGQLLARASDRMLSGERNEADRKNGNGRFITLARRPAGLSVASVTRPSAAAVRGFTVRPTLLSARALTSLVS